jgi:hypothetical protein
MKLYLELPFREFFITTYSHSNSRQPCLFAHPIIPTTKHLPVFLDLTGSSLMHYL